MCPSQSCWKKCCLSPHFVAEGLKQQWVGSLAQDVYKWASNLWSAQFRLTELHWHLMGGWEDGHMLWVLMEFQFLKMAIVRARGSKCVMRRIWGWSWRKWAPAMGSEHPSSCTWHCQDSFNQDGGEKFLMVGRFSWEASAQSYESGNRVFELRLKVFEPIACVPGS